MWTNLTVLKALVPLANSCSSTFWTFPFWTLLSFSHLLVQNYHTDCSDCCWWGSSRQGQLDRLDKNKHWPLEGKIIWCHVCCAKHERSNKIQVFWMQCGFMYWPMFWSVSYQTAFLRRKYYNCNYWTGTFSSTFSKTKWWSTGCEYYRRFPESTET